MRNTTRCSATGSSFSMITRRNYSQEWISAKYYKETDIEGVPSGRYIMVFEYESLDGHHAYKKRRNYKGPYAPYKLVDPYYHYFNYDETTCTYWQPNEPERWLDTDKK